MMYQFDKQKITDELEAHYRTYPTNVDHLYEKLEALDEMHKGASYAQRKTYVYQVAVEHCAVKIMPACPFYFELDTGRLRNSVTSTWDHEPGLANWLIEKNTSLREKFDTFIAPYRENLMISGSMFTDFAHHYADVEKVLQYGLRGIQEQVIYQKESAESDEKAYDFLDSIEKALTYAMLLSERFATKAEEMLQEEADAARRAVLLQIAKTAREVPARPAETFYEALATITFIREMCNALEGIGFAVLGHLDRILYPYYAADLEAGRITRGEARALLDAYLAITDARWDLNVPLPGGTNATVVIGGCDRDGRVVYNEVTKMILESFLEHRFANPKLQARVLEDHPSEYFALLGEVAAAGTNVLSVFNDAVIIKAQQQAGKDLHSARLYLAGGCQEPTLSNELNSRAYVYLNLAAMLDVSLFPETWQPILKRDEIDIMPACKRDTFAAFYKDMIYNLSTQMHAFARAFNGFGREWPVTNPCPLYSAFMEGCVESARDISEGGATYNADSFGLTGLGTTIDALLAIKKAVYEEKAISMQALKEALQNNFEENISLQQYLQNKMPKLGHADEEVRTFAAQFISDLAGTINGVPNARGGYFESSFFTFYAFEWFKDFKATADGRRQGTHLSRGVNPCESTIGIDAATLLYAQEPIDYKEHAGGGVLYMDLPLVKGKQRGDVFSGVIQLFVQNGGCIMDFNVIDKAQLLAAQKNPEQYRNLVVRVCGYSALFHSLDKEMQDEIIARAQR